MKRAISFLLTILMLVSIVPIQALAVEENGENLTLDPRELTIDGVGSVGMLLSNALTEEQQEKSQELEHIADVEITGNVATVTYQVLDDDCSVVVALYDDEHPETMLASGTAEVTADETKVEVTFDGTMPEHFLAMAYLIDRQTLAPRCSAFVSRLYTREMQEFLATTVADYDEDLVLNLDDDDTTNFAVFSEDTQQLESSGVENRLTDNGDGTYTVTNADESFTDLEAGDVFSYPMEDDQVLLVKVKDISINGSTVTITEDEDVELADFFDYVKIESDGTGGEMTVDTSVADEGVTYDPTEQEAPVLNSGDYDCSAPTLGALVDIDGSLTYSASFKLNKKFVETDKVEVKLTGKVGIDFGISVKCYIDWGYQYVSFKLENKLNLAIGLSGKLTMVEIPLARLEIPVLPGVNVGFIPSFVAEVSASIDFKTSIKTTVGFAYDSKAGWMSLCAWPKMESSLDFSGTLFVGIQAEPFVSIISADMCKASVKFSAGVELEGKENIWKSSAGARHDCQFCVAGDVSIRFEVSVGIDIIKGWVKLEHKLASARDKIAEFYCSVDHHEFGFGKCPYISYKTTVTVKDEDGNPMANAVIHGTGLSSAPVTGSSGKAIFYLPTGKYTLSVIKDDVTRKKTFSVRDGGKSVEISFVKPADHGGGGGGGGGGGRPGEPDWGGVVDSGDCGAQGDNVQWKLYENGLLYIYGTGQMQDYGSQSYWRYDPVKSVVIESGVTGIGANAFNNCGKLADVSIPDSVVSIGDGAFTFCPGLTDVTIGPGVASVGTRAFLHCHNLTDVTIPGSVITIGDNAFTSCWSLTGITIPDSVVSLGAGAFNDCPELTYAVIGSSVTAINDDTFGACTNLTDLTIGSSVTYIGEEAFWGSPDLTDVYYTGTQAQWAAIAIDASNVLLFNAIIHYNAAAPVLNAPEPPVLWEEASGPAPLGAMLPAEETTEDTTTEDGGVFTSCFNGLYPGMDYVLLVVEDPEAEELLAPENLLYIAQGTAGEDGTLTFTYRPMAAADKALPYAGGLMPADLNGDGAADVLDMACLYTYLSTGENEGTLNEEYFAAVADVNGDGNINILDYQALYEIVKK